MGSVYKNAKLDIMEQHLGLEPIFLKTNANKIIKSISSVIKSSINVDSLLNPRVKKRQTFKSVKMQIKNNSYNLKIGIAKDSAFGFYYADDIDKFKSYGETIKYFNTL